MKTNQCVVHASIACVIVGLLPTCSGGGTSAPATSYVQSPQLTRGELKLIFGPQPNDTIVVHTDGSFEIVVPQQTSMRACGGVCPRRIERFTVTGEKILQGSRELLSRAANGNVDMWGLGQATIDHDGVLIQSGQQRAVDANGRLPHVDGEPDVTIVGAATPELRRRAMLVFVFVSLEIVAAAFDEASH
jgi:hypothetical protein